LTFKVGDKVEAVTGVTILERAKEWGAATILAVDPADALFPYRVEFEDGGREWRKAEELRPIAPATKFKVGDEVAYAPAPGQTTFGVVKDVDAVDPTLYCVEFSDGPTRTPKVWLTEAALTLRADAPKGGAWLGGKPSGVFVRGPNYEYVGGPMHRHVEWRWPSVVQFPLHLDDPVWEAAKKAAEPATTKPALVSRADHLDEAKRITAGRGESYGTPEDNFERIAARWRVHIKNRFGVDVAIDPMSVALMCADLKLARLEHDPLHLDSIVDLLGYGACYGEIAAKQRAGTWAEAAE
jgi:hypothetical protein